MYLKSIEIQGFKSFAKKIVFDFPNGITGIVGPNGSGKSNVADAVRWVLGEQRIKQLRGSKMEDVIFAGTASRKPLGFAYVGITLDNSDHKLRIDFDEVTISRKVYRSGESEYMINGSICRLRDVQELFYDTGIGKEGYSIIGQGQIDKILQGKPEERRELFDEAAGIVKFKKRKIIAVRKLENERLNLQRVTDILSELSRQVGPLKRQSEAAEKFVALRQEQKNYDINLFLIENSDIRNKIKDYEEKEKIASEDLEASRNVFENAKAEYERLSENILEIDSQIDDVKKQISQCEIIRENLVGQINVLNEQINSARDSESRLEERVKEIEETISSKEAEKAALEKDFDENKAALKDNEERQKAQDQAVLDVQNDMEELRLKNEELKEMLIANVNAKGEINARIERLKALMEQMDKRKAEIEETLGRFTSDKDAQEEKVKELTAEYDLAKGDVDKLEKALADKNAEIESAAKDIKSLSSQKDLAAASAIQNAAKLESVRNITERYEGYGSSIKEVMKLKEKKSGIHGVVADIIKTEKKYETAIETALGGSIQNIVTDTENTAKEAIEYLKANKLGRATFLPLRAVTGIGEFKNVEVLEEKGVIGLASSLVDVDKKYQGVANYLLGRIVVVDNIDNALAIARKYRYSIIIVTLDGELLNRGGSITGGAFKNKSNLLGRRREIEELENKIAESRKQQEDFDRKIKLLTDKNAILERESNDLQAELQENRIYLNTVTVNLEQAKARQNELESNYNASLEESQNITEQSSAMTGDNSGLKNELEQNALDNDKIKNQITDAEKQQEEYKQKETEELEKSHELRLEHSKLVEKSSYLTESCIRVEGEIAKQKEDFETLKAGSEKSGESIAQKLGEINSINDSIDECDKQHASLSETLEGLEHQKEEQAGSHKVFIDRREEYANRVADLDKEVFRLSQAREKLEERFENRASYIWEEYELTYNSALALRDESLTDTKLMREHIQELKNAIRSLGTINVGAIEEYKDIKERYDFLTTQHEDLVKAEADIVKGIKDLDREMRKQFNQEFKRIKAEFSKVFVEMFGGGYGDIILEEDVDVLDAGISIIAQPPGKKLQNMMQLSGGEKALTAIAVLFAIQNLKPSPFCILDEIEAALDDSNIVRFASYLHKLSGEIQFIVITHRKGTMEAADRLYGITMQEKGVSTLISVNLEDVTDEKA
ncbi:MAG: chromosome segregation protein SMC [Lachnospiraceae bacterium]|nr:chromosome segregation protein SMC [Lachnospiraceae bacterium]